MSAVVTAAVVVLVFIYLRMNRQARLRWLQQIDLPGLWREQVKTGQAEASELRLLGGIASGEYRLLEGDEEQRGQWQFRGDELVLSPRQGDTRALTLRLFKPGEISLQDASGTAQLFHKQTDNVVSLQPPSKDT